MDSGSGVDSLACVLGKKSLLTWKTGRYERNIVADEVVAAFIPKPLPPSEPPLVLEGRLDSSLKRAEGALGRLELTGAMVPSVSWFLYSLVRKEAVISSQIEGTQATLMDLLAFEAAGKVESDGTADIQEVCNYLDALNFARQQLHNPKGLPVSVRLLNETHRRLMRGVRGAEKRPGELRRSQNWIGGTRPGNAAYVPPPAHAVGTLLNQVEKFIHRKSAVPAIVRAGLVNVQFETIHPYLDGNGRIGRLLITLLFEHYHPDNRLLDEAPPPDKPAPPRRVELPCDRGQVSAGVGA